MDPKTNQRRQHEASAARQAEREGGENAADQQPGVMSVVGAVRDLDFPMTVDELAERAGDRTVQTSKDKRFRLREVLPKLKENEFPSIRDFQESVQRHWEGIEFLEVPEEQRPKEGGFQPQQKGG